MPNIETEELSKLELRILDINNKSEVFALCSDSRSYGYHTNFNYPERTIKAWAFRGTNFFLCLSSNNRTCLSYKNYRKSSFRNISVEEMLSMKEFPKKYKKALIFNIDLIS